MVEDCFGEFKAGGFEEGGPVNAMEPGVVFAEDVEVGGPELFVFFLEGRGVVVEEGVEPDVGDVVFVEGNWDAPVEVCSGDGEIVEAFFYSGDDFVTAFFGEDEFWMFFVEFEKEVLVFAEFEKVGWFFEMFEGFVVNGAVFIWAVGFCVVLLAVGAVEAFVFP